MTGTQKLSVPIIDASRGTSLAHFTCNPCSHPPKLNLIKAVISGMAIVLASSTSIMHAFEVVKRVYGKIRHFCSQYRYI